jgi:hypothetical protein
VRRAATAAAARIPWLLDGYRLARDPRGEMALRRDLAATRVAASFLRRVNLPEPAISPVAVFAMYRDNVFETKLDLLLASALRLHGMDVVISVPSGTAHRVRRYARAFGVDRVVAQDSLQLTSAEHAECTTAIEELTAAHLSFESVGEWTFRGYSIGTHVLSTLIRTTFDGSPDLSRDANRDRLSAILDDVLANVLRAERIVRELAPRVLLVQEANYSTNGPLVDVAVRHGIDVIQSVPIWRDDALVSKRLTTATRRHDAKSVAPGTVARVQREVSTHARDAALDADFAARYGGVWELARRLQPGTEARSAQEIVAELGLDPDLATAVIFTHVLWDGSLFYGKDLFENYADWLVQTVAAAAGNPRVNWVVKTHPSSVYLASRGYATPESSELAVLRRRFARLPDHVHVVPPDTSISSLSLLRFADYGVTVRGTPGLEMACFGKPAFTAGTGTFAGLGFTYDSDNTAEYLERLATIHEYGPLSTEMTERARWYAYALFIRRPWVTRSFSMAFDDDRTHELRRSVRLAVQSTDEIVERGDLDHWARWVLHSSEVDYVPEPAPCPNGDPAPCPNGDPAPCPNGDQARKPARA